MNTGFRSITGVENIITLIGATEDESVLKSKHRNSFFCVYHFDSYSQEELRQIFSQESSSRNIRCSENVYGIISKRSGGNPGKGLAILKKALDFFLLDHTHEITEAMITDFLVSTGHNESCSADEVVDRLISDDVKVEVWRRDQARCVRCGSNERLEFDHIIILYF